MQIFGCLPRHLQHWAIDWVNSIPLRTTEGVYSSLCSCSFFRRWWLNVTFPYEGCNNGTKVKQTTRPVVQVLAYGSVALWVFAGLSRFETTFAPAKYWVTFGHLRAHINELWCDMRTLLNAVHELKQNAFESIRLTWHVQTSPSKPTRRPTLTDVCRSRLPTDLQLQMSERN